MFRAFYIPWLSQQYTHYVNYVLLRNKVNDIVNDTGLYNIDDNIIIIENFFEVTSIIVYYTAHEFDTE